LQAKAYKLAFHSSMLPPSFPLHLELHLSTKLHQTTIKTSLRFLQWSLWDRQRSAKFSGKLRVWVDLWGWIKRRQGRLFWKQSKKHKITQGKL